MSGENAKSEEARKNVTPDRNLHGVPEICINNQNEHVWGVDSDGEDESVAHGWALIASARPH